MNTSKRVTAASAAAVLGLFLAGCDNNETEEAPEAPAETTAPMEEGATTEPTDGAGMGEDAATDTGADGTAPEGDTGGADTDTDTDTDN